MALTGAAVLREKKDARAAGERHGRAESAEEILRLRRLAERALALLSSMRSTGVDEIGRLRGDIRAELEKR